MKFKNFNIADVLGPDDIKQAKQYVGKKGYYANHIEILDRAIAQNDHLSTLCGIDEDDDYGKYLIKDNTEYSCHYIFFLPLEAIKEDKPKEKVYRPIKNMRELTDVVQGKDWDYDISTDCEIIVRRKDDIADHRIKMLITILELQKDRSSGQDFLYMLNYRLMSSWFDNYEIMNNKGEWVPFGVEVTEE